MSKEEPNPTVTVFIREDEIFTGDESMFTLHFSNKAKLKEYFPKVDEMETHEYFVKTDIKKPIKERIIVRIIHPDTKHILVLYGNISKYGSHPKKPERKGLYCKLANLDHDQIVTILNFIK